MCSSELSWLFWIPALLDSSLPLFSKSLLALGVGGNKGVIGISAPWTLRTSGNYRDAVAKSSADPPLWIPHRFLWFLRSPNALIPRCPSKGARPCEQQGCQRWTVLFCHLYAPVSLCHSLTPGELESVVPLLGVRASWAWRIFSLLALDQGRSFP